MEYALLAFVSTHTAMVAQRLLNGHVPFTVMPTLRAITHSCGISLRLAPDEADTARTYLKTGGLTDEQVRYFAVYPGERCEPFVFPDQAEEPPAITTP